MKVIPKIGRIASAIVLTLLLVFTNVNPVFAFCGFYVSGADTKLFNKASQVILARDGNNTILTMANDFQGAVKDFAIVIPVPVPIKREQVKVGKKVIVDKLDTFTQPRLVEYFDSDPCSPVDESVDRPFPAAPSAIAPRRSAAATERDRGVTIEDSFKVNEYEILILSARESDGLELWLRERGYKLPSGASELLRPYIRQQMKFFVAKVDLKEFENQGFQVLRPLQIAYNSPKFMLPIRLGMANANGEQDLVIYVLSPQGRVELANYRTVKIPTNANIPSFVKQEFGDFYKAMFQQAYQRENRRVGFLEYAWDTSNCDPCSTTPPTAEELREAGVFWLDGGGSSSTFPGNSRNLQSSILPPRRPFPPRFNSNVFVTRLHVRYNRSNFPEDLVFQQTSNRENFQGRYIMQQPFSGSTNCSAGVQYRRGLRDRFEREIATTANLTGWNPADIRRKMNFSLTNTPAATPDEPFWRRIWRGNP
jgi:hypothetical protein